MLFINRVGFAAITCFLLLTSCEKVIEVDLNTASPKYVIEAAVTNSHGPNRVRLTKTKKFDENNDFEGVSTAEVTIADDAGNTETLTYTVQGVYETSELVGIPGRTYFLTVNIGGKTFTAASVMPALVRLDSLYLETFTIFSDTIKVPTVKYKDPPGIRNFYRHILYVNNAKAESLYISTDERNNGRQIEKALPYSGDDGLKAGDIITIEMQTIGKAIYDFYFSLDQTKSQSAATPANPVSNINGGALGYFSAHSTQTKTFVVK